MVTITPNKVQIRTDEKPVTFTTIEIGNYSKDKAESIKQKIESKTNFMNFSVIVCPFNRSFNVMAQTSYKAKKDAILGEFIGLMATLI